MPPPEGYVKAKLAIEGGETIQVLFNPTEYTITKGNNWTFDPIKGTSLPTGKFGGGKPREMQVNLLLDQSLPNGEMSVKDITDKLFKMMEVKGGTGAGAGDAVPAARHLPVGRDDPLQGGLHLAHRRLPALQAERHADPRRRQARAHAGGDRDLRASAKSKNKKQNPTTRSPAGSASTSSRTATRCSPSRTRPTATRTAGASSPRPTASTTRCTCAAARRSTCPGSD